MQPERKVPKQDLKNRLYQTWLGSSQQAVNTQRFWIYLSFIGISLCLICLVRAVKHF